MLVKLVGIPPLQRRTLGSRDMRTAAARSDRDHQRQGSAPQSHGWFGSLTLPARAC
jgi:hypothetical protein